MHTSSHKSLYRYILEKSFILHFTNVLLVVHLSPHSGIHLCVLSELGLSGTSNVIGTTHNSSVQSVQELHYKNYYPFEPVAICCTWITPEPIHRVISTVSEVVQAPTLFADIRKMKPRSHDVVPWIFTTKQSAGTHTL